uniref:Suppressor APC domain-containing protein 2-like n=3 Tax=Callorhinchus milii TaxID=7868 RepID=A0A4W3IS17_CALMI|eukprot:gi/632969217/ref/XP_007900968.1/ PREDICTED: suppressor APC domain-containing protein 2-like [Callorhinchus milii]
MNTPDLVQERVSEADPDCCAVRGDGHHNTDCQDQMEVQMNVQTGVEGKCMSRYQSESNATGMPYSRRGNRDRTQPRRHTITSGVDYDLLKRMKELEQEKDALLQGLEVVDCAREWYLRQIQAVQERQKQVGKITDAREFCSENNKKRMSQLLSKLQEVKLCLRDLISSSGKPWTASCCDVNGLPAGPGNKQHVTMLKEQNRLLTKEVTAQSERITQLEQEKSALIKQLFEARARSRVDSSHLDSTFI